MKLITTAIILSLFVGLDAASDIQKKHDLVFVPPQPRNKASNAMHGRERMTRLLSDQEIDASLDNLEKQPYSLHKLAHIRQLMMRSRRNNIPEQLKVKFNTLLEDACKNYDKNNRREVIILKGVLNLSQQGKFLNNDHKANINKIIADIVEPSEPSAKEKTSLTPKNLSSIKAKDDYQTKANYLYQMMRRSKSAGNINKYVQSETSSAIHDLYAQRPLNNVAMLSKLRDILSFGQNTPLLSTINQYEVKEIMLPEVSKNLDKAVMLARQSNGNAPTIAPTETQTA